MLDSLWPAGSVPLLFHVAGMVVLPLSHSLLAGVSLRTWTCTYSYSSKLRRAPLIAGGIDFDMK